MSKFKIGDRVYFAYAGADASAEARGYGTIQGIGTDPNGFEFYYVHKDGEEPYEDPERDGWLVEPAYRDMIEHEYVYNSPLYKALS